jgi:hypothetical protein
LRALVRDGHSKDVLIPDDLIARADQVLAAVATVFPAKVGQYVAGPILELGWGRPISIVTMTAGVVFTFPNPVAIVIIGEFRIALPEPDAPIINLQADFAGIIDVTTGDVSFDASLARSRIAAFDVAGDIALRGGSESFVFTAGGFNPLFAPPPDLTSVRRLSISISPSPLLKVWAESYFAVTASSFQFGAAMYMEAKLGPIGAKGHVSLDTLIRTEPKLHFIATIAGEFDLTVEGEEIATLNVDVLLEGPGRWHARAHASISILFFSVSGTLELEWGTDSLPELGPPVDVAQRVHDALALDSTRAAHPNASARRAAGAGEAAADAFQPGVVEFVAGAAEVADHLGSAVVEDHGRQVLFAEHRQRFTGARAGARAEEARRPAVEHADLAQAAREHGAQQIVARGRQARGDHARQRAVREHAARERDLESTLRRGMPNPTSACR